MDTEQNPPQRRSIRLPNFDYSGNATYFITVCAFNRWSLFGAITDGRMSLTDLGHIVKNELAASLHIRRELDIHHSVVMPNHLHVLLTITPPHSDAPIIPVAPSIDGHHAPGKRAPRSLGSFVAGFKGAATKRIREIKQDPDFAVWQRNYYEHVVRNETSFQKIWEYIDTNPQRWEQDRGNPERR